MGPAKSRPEISNGQAGLVRVAGKFPMYCFAERAYVFWHTTHIRLIFWSNRLTPGIK